MGDPGPYPAGDLVRAEAANLEHGGAWRGAAEAVVDGSRSRPRMRQGGGPRARRTRLGEGRRERGR